MTGNEQLILEESYTEIDSVPRRGAFLAGIAENGETVAETTEHLEELRELVKTLGHETVGEMRAVVRQQNARYFLGTGKAEELRDAAEKAHAALIVFDAELGPSQQRNLEKLCGIKVVDRQEVILDIFAGRARTREAVLQVELARCKYFLPRLTRAWSHLSRQRGGAMGTRGEGEKQIENDRRSVKLRISKMEAELADVRKQRCEQRKNRLRHSVPHAAIVGYTNAGKSSLLNRLTGADAYVQDQLFATLDPTTRRLELPDKSQLLLTDTVGFVRKLPHDLVEAFKSTLEETVLSDFLVLVLDVSSPFVSAHWETTLSVLNDLGAGDKPIQIVFNKCDRLQDQFVLNNLRANAPEAVFISCETGEGLDALKQAFLDHVRKTTGILQLRLPAGRGDLIAALHARGTILESEYLEDGTFCCAARVPENFCASLRPFTMNNIH